METLTYVLINAVTIYLFVAKPFVWTHEPNQIQRFIWWSKLSKKSYFRFWQSVVEMNFCDVDAWWLPCTRLESLCNFSVVDKEDVLLWILFLFGQKNSWSIFSLYNVLTYLLLCDVSRGMFNYYHMLQLRVWSANILNSQKLIVIVT